MIMALVFAILSAIVGFHIAMFVGYVIDTRKNGAYVRDDKELTKDDIKHAVTQAMLDKDILDTIFDKKK